MQPNIVRKRLNCQLTKQLTAIFILQQIKILNCNLSLYSFHMKKFYSLHHTYLKCTQFALHCFNGSGREIERERERQPGLSLFLHRSLAKTRDSVLYLHFTVTWSLVTMNHTSYWHNVYKCFSVRYNIRYKLMTMMMLVLVQIGNTFENGFLPAFYFSRGFDQN